eukprot:COSAG02_NODE_1411_length_12757_cov_226.591642_3_plen_87_part_00
MFVSPKQGCSAEFGSIGSISSLRRRGGTLGFPLPSAAYVRSSAPGAVERSRAFQMGHVMGHVCTLTLLKDQEHAVHNTANHSQKHT